MIVDASSYEPTGPLSMLSRGNGLTEARDHDTRFYPSAIQVGTGTNLFDWTYSNDALGNPTSIVDALDSGNNRTYGYQEFQYYLTQGNGPWGSLDWTYDRVGNRLTETRDMVTDTYAYVPNLAGNNSPKLDQIQLGLMGARTFQYDAAGHQTQVNAAGNAVDQTYDDAGRLSLQQRSAAEAESTFHYDGRDFLILATGRSPAPASSSVFCDGFETGDTSAWDSGSSSTCFQEEKTGPVYSSDGTLRARDTDLLLYFANSPVAQRVGGAWQHLTTDPLGTPVFASDLAGCETWQGGFEPFGVDFAQAGAANIFVRLPGQWDDGSWAESSQGAAAFYNVHRWYSPGLGLYNRVDPLGLEAGVHPFRYAFANPLTFVDVDGLEPGRRSAETGAKVGRQLACAMKWGQQARWRGNELGWPWAHCWASCKIAKECGGKGLAEAVGYAKEGLDVFKCGKLIIGKQPLNIQDNCASAFQDSDLKDNETGYTCPTEVTCDDLCREISEDGKIPPPGPLFGIAKRLQRALGN